MRYLLTGGAGFVGSHLSDLLLERGHSVHIIDNLSTGSMENIRHLKSHARFEYTIGSADNTPLVAELVDDADGIFHLAAAVGVELIIKSPVQAIETNVHLTEVLLAQAAKKSKPVLIASTSEVYGKSTDLPFREDGDLKLGATHLGRWSYACSKAIDEFLAIAYYKEKGLPTVVARLFNTVGPRQTGRYGMVIPRFVKQALAGEDITVYGDGTQQRCFCHVQDAVIALADLLETDKAYGEVVNVGSQEEVTISQLAERVKQRANSTSKANLIPYSEAYQPGFEDMFRRIPDTTKVNNLVGWSPKHTLDEIIDDVIAHQQGTWATARVSN